MVFLHELGHFMFSRLFKVRVDKFYLFFNPNFSLFRAKKVNGKWQYKFLAKNVPANERQKVDADGQGVVDAKGKPVMEPIPVAELEENDWRKYPESTEWGIGWLPLGGYCKIAGMIDESMDAAQLNQQPEEWEYRSRPTWQRLPIIIGGVLVNFILAMVIYAAVLFTWGEEYIPVENAKYGFQYSPTLIENGFQHGDQILSVDGKKFTDRSEFANKMLLSGKATSVSLLRDGQEVELSVPDLSQRLLANEEMQMMTLRYPFVIAEVSAGSPAAKANLEKGDSVVAINGESVVAVQDVSELLEKYKEETVVLAFFRNGEAQETKLTIDENGKMGVQLCHPTQFFQTQKVEYTFVEAIPAGIKLGWTTLTNYVKSMKLVFTKEGSKQVGGFAAIGKLFPTAWDWQTFWMMTALLSVILAFMNFLPIPALDGGHVMFLLYEMISGKKPSDKFLENAQAVGMILLLALLVYANGNDIFKAFFK